MRLIQIILILVTLLMSDIINAEEYIIKTVPFFSSEDFQCGPASLAMVLNFLGEEVTSEEIAKEICSTGAGGTSDFDMIRYASQKGFRVSQYRGSIEDIKEKIKSQKPLIVMTDEGFWFYKKYHYMVVVGFDERFVIVNSGTEKHKRIGFSDFLKKWSKTDFWTLLIE